jgi:hypothetical protein
MRVLKKLLFMLVLLCAAGAAGAWLWAGRLDPPSIEIRQPGEYVGQASMLEMVAQAPEGTFSALQVTIEQNGKTFPVFTFDPATGTGSAEQGDATVTQESPERLYVMRPIGKRAIPELEAGAARIVAHASSPVFYGIRELEATVTRDVQVRLEPPRVAVLSTFHFVNHGGSEFVVYRATPEDVQSGVRVGGKEYPGFPAKGAGIGGDPALRVAFFALLYDQPSNANIQVFARDPAGNEATTPLDYRVFPKPFRKSRITVDDRFLNRVVPAIAQNTPDEDISTDDVLAGFLTINGELRQKNNQFIRDLAQKTAPEMLFKDAFQQLGNSQVEAGFADARTYVYQGKEVDQQVHLGFDLAATANVPISSAQRGIVVYADFLGIYGNCVIVDHGLGVQSLYAHLSSIDVAPGDRVEKGQPLGRSGMTGLAGGDHLHFTMLVGGEQVSPVDWWSPQWLQDRVLRKIAAASSGGGS